MTKRLFNAWLIASILLLATSSSAWAVKPLPYGPFGSVKINGAWVPIGTPVRAFCSGMEVASAPTEPVDDESWYTFSVVGDDSETAEVEGCVSGETVTFTVDGWPADQTATWVSGESERVDLTATRPEPAIDVEKTTNGLDADAAPGPPIRAGDGVTWTYAVSNTGNVPLTGVSVTDDLLGPIACGETALAVGQGMTCTLTGTADPGAYLNLATAEGIYETTIVSDTDLSHYFGEDPQVDIEKATNGMDADAVPGLYIVVGDAITWTYAVTNTGNVSLSAVEVVDSDLGPIGCPQATLAVDAVMVCDAYGTAIEGQYANTGWVTATTSTGWRVSDRDRSAYYGAKPGLAFEKLTQGVDADVAPGPYVLEGTPVTWTYAVTNTGNITLTGVTVTDDQGVDVTCPDAVLAPQTWMECAASETVVAGPYRNQGIVTAEPWVGSPVTETDWSHYFGMTPDVTIEKATNGVDADMGTGPLILVGQPVTWTYTVTNTGNITLTGVTLTDDQGVDVTCPDTMLSPWTSMECRASGTAEAGQYANRATVTGTTPVGSTVSDADPSHYYGVTVGIALEKATNGVDADEPPGPYVLVGEPVTWTYAVTNTGNITLTDITVTDSQSGVVTCPTEELGAGLSMMCEVTGTAALGPFVNTAGVRGTPPLGGDATDEDTSHYYGANPTLVIEKATNGEDADAAPGPVILEGDPVTWTYAISNTGNVTLTNVVVDDGREGIIACEVDSLLPGAHTVCELGGTAVPGQYVNLGTVTGVPPGGLAQVEASDPSHYFSYTPYPSVGLEKRANGYLEPEPPGLFITVGEPVTWTYTVLNTGNTPLLDLGVYDDSGTPGDPDDDVEVCTIETLDVETTTLCTATGTADIGPYVNTAEVTGTALSGEVVSATSASHYYGAAPGLAFDKLTQGEDADAVPGPYVLAGTPVTWSYVVTNTGNITLTGVTVTDSQGVEVTCLDTVLSSNTSITCTASETATAGAYSNIGAVTAKPWVGEILTETDISHYFGITPRIHIEKMTNGVDADRGPGVFVPAGQSITWTYAITNTGNVSLSGIKLVDSELGELSCSQANLAVDEGIVCETYGTAIEGPYRNTAWVTATVPTGMTVSDWDESGYYGTAPELMIEKLTLELDADQSPGPLLWAGGAVTWTYLVTNTGNVTLTQVSLIDDVEGEIACPQDGLAPDEGTACYGYGTAVVGEYANLVSARGNSPDGTIVEASDASHYFGGKLNLDIHLSLSIDDGASWFAANEPPGPFLLSGTDPQVRLVITNTGNVTIPEVDLTSTAIDLASCGVVEGLQPEEVWACVIEPGWNPGPHLWDVEASAIREDDVGRRRSLDLSDRVYYHGAVPGLELGKFVSGDGARWYAADVSPGPAFFSETAPRYRFVITNTGNVVLSDLDLGDDGLALDACLLPSSIEEGGVFQCEATDVWASGQNTNTASASANFTDTTGAVASLHASDRAHYFGTAAGISAEKRVSTDRSMWLDADAEGTALEASMGTALSWRIDITNTGTVPITLTLVDQQDDIQLDLDALCDELPPDVLSPGAAYECIYEDPTAFDSPGVHHNTVSVEGLYEDLRVSALDAAYVRIIEYKVYLPLILR